MNTNDNADTVTDADDYVMYDIIKIVTDLVILYYKIPINDILYKSLNGN